VRNLIHRLFSPFMKYDERVRLASRVMRIDYRFLGAIVALVVAVVLSLRFV